MITIRTRMTVGQKENLRATSPALKMDPVERSLVCFSEGPAAISFFHTITDGFFNLVEPAMAT